MTSQDVDLVR